MAANYSSHFANLRARHPQASYPESECSTLVVYLNGDMSAPQCATDITKYTNRRVPVNEKLCVWSLIISMALGFSETHDDLITLIKEIRTVAPSKDTGGIDWANEGQCFAEEFRSFYDGIWSLTLAADQAGGQNKAPERSETSQQWTNINAFSARLQHAELASDLVNGLTLIVSTLERQKTPAQLEMNLGAAAAWLEFASSEIKSGAAKVAKYIPWAKESERKKSGEVDGKRLASWRERLSKLSGAPGLSEEVVSSCERAANAIELALWEKKK